MTLSTNVSFSGRWIASDFPSRLSRLGFARLVSLETDALRADVGENLRHRPIAVAPTCGRGCARRRLDPGRTNEALQSCYSGAPGRPPGSPPLTLLTRRAHVQLHWSTRPTRSDTVGDVVAGQPFQPGGETSLADLEAFHQS